MAVINWNQVVLFPSLPYNDKYPTQNTEAFYASALNILNHLKAINFQVSDITNFSIDAGTLNLTGVEEAIRELAYRNITIDFGAWRMTLHGTEVSLGT